MDVPFVKFIQQDRANAFEEGIIQKLPGEDAFGKNAQARVAPDPAIEANVIPNFAAEFPPLLVGNPLGRRPRRDPARLQHHDGGMVMIEDLGGQ
jgi:hypothetical protein